MTGADDFELLYEHEERAAIDSWRSRRSGSVGGPHHGSSDPRPIGPAAWRRSSASGAVAAAVLLGLRDVLEPPADDEVQVVVDADEPADPDGPVVVRFDPDEPANTVAVLYRR